MGDGLVAGHSPIDRVLKRHPEMKRFETFTALIPGTSETRLLSNAATGEPAEYSTLQAILAGVPRSYPFGAVVMHFHAPVFGERLIGLPKFGHSLPGVMVTDNRWVTGRHRALSVYTVVEADEGTRNSAQSGARRCRDQGLRESEANRSRWGSWQPDWAVRIGGFHPARERGSGKGHRRRLPRALKEVVAAGRLTAQFTAGRGNSALRMLGVTAGPRKPALEAAFKPMGYGCRGGSGEFHLTRRTSGNLTVELYLDVGTWSHSVSAIFPSRARDLRRR